LAVSFATSFLMLAVGAYGAPHSSVPPGKWAALMFDPATTTIDYSLTGWPHLTQGTFKLKHGMIRVDPANGKMDGAIVVDATSGNSGHSIRDWRMKSGILDVARYPDITFDPQQVVSHGAPIGEFPVAVRGVMTLHGAKHPFTIHAMVQRQGDSVTIHSDFVVPYVAWGLENPTVLFFTVAKKADIKVTAVTHLNWVSP
jgi:polyisoprenoid-binding protein YceI